MTHPGGRPRKWTAKRVREEAQALAEWLKDDAHYWLGDFPTSRGYSIQRLSEWAKQFPEFSEQWLVAKEVCAARLLKAGLSEAFNPSLTFKTLVNIAGWRGEPQRLEHTGPEGGPISFILPIPPKPENDAQND